MINPAQLSLIILAGISVGVADALIKKITLTGNFSSAFKNPLMLVIILLYIVQIVFLAYILKNQWKLGIVGNLQMVFYSVTVILSGLIIFGEKISLVQWIGIGLALVGGILMNL